MCVFEVFPEFGRTVLIAIKRHSKGLAGMELKRFPKTLVFDMIVSLAPPFSRVPGGMGLLPHDSAPTYFLVCYFFCWYHAFLCCFLPVLNYCPFSPLPQYRSFFCVHAKQICYWYNFQCVQPINRVTSSQAGAKQPATGYVFCTNIPRAVADVVNLVGIPSMDTARSVLDDKKLPCR